MCCGGDLQSYDGSVATVVHGDITLSLCEAALKFNPCNKFTKSCFKCSSGCRKIGASVKKTEYSAPHSVIMLQFAQTLKCQHRYQEHHYCHQVIEQYLTKLND